MLGLRGAGVIAPQRPRSQHERERRREAETGEAAVHPISPRWRCRCGYDPARGVAFPSRAQTHMQVMVNVPLTCPSVKGHAAMDLLASHREFYPLLLGLMALSGLAVPLMAWWSERR
jgi:hypothetical protein